MTHNELFAPAKWVMPKEDLTCAVFKNTFCVDALSSLVEIVISGLGYFNLYINGDRVGDDYFVPAYSDYIPRTRENMELEYPLNDKMDNRIYCMKYDISPYLHLGENTIEVMVGGGYFHQIDRYAEGNMDYGNIRLCYKISNADDVLSVSNTSVKYQQGFVKKSSLFYGEIQDFTDIDNTWYGTVLCDNMENVPVYIQSCNTDKPKRSFNPVKVKDLGDCSLYDVGENITGFAIVRCNKKNEKIVLEYAENINDDFTLRFDSTGYDCRKQGFQKQGDTFITDGEREAYYPNFVWHGFRYFTVTNNAEVKSVVEIHADCNITSAFECSDDTINWLYGTYVHTQLCNTHSAVMTDCPHRERLGYTGDGQLCSIAGMLTLDMQSIYKKWIYDLIDCQDKTTGHVQHTAPFAGGGGGPAGWGGAMLTVPYNYYKQYGEFDFLKECYPYMKSFVKYMESRCENGIIVKEEDGGWCLGDWCTIDKVEISAEFVNTCMYISQLNLVKEVEEILSMDNTETDALIQTHRASVLKQFPMDSKGSFLDGIQGADAFAVDCGIGFNETLNRLYEKYAKNTTYDTGIFGTYLLNGVLLNNGYADLALKLLSNKTQGSYYNMKSNGATTLWERWNGEDSHNHPMFGASVRYLFDSVLGITQKNDSYGYDKILIAPAENTFLSFAKGYIHTVKGKISVEFKKGDNVEFVITLPPDTTAEFVYGSYKATLHGGENKFTI